MLLDLDYKCKNFSLSFSYSWVRFQTGRFSHRKISKSHCMLEDARPCNESSPNKSWHTITWANVFRGGRPAQRHQSGAPTLANTVRPPQQVADKSLFTEVSLRSAQRDESVGSRGWQWGGGFHRDRHAVRLMSAVCLTKVGVVSSSCLHVPGTDTCVSFVPGTERKCRVCQKYSNTKCRVC